MMRKRKGGMEEGKGVMAGDAAGGLMSAFDRAEVAGITQAIGINYWPA